MRSTAQTSFNEIQRQLQHAEGLKKPSSAEQELKQTLNKLPEVEAGLVTTRSPCP